MFEYYQVVSLWIIISFSPLFVGFIQLFLKDNF